MPLFRPDRSTVLGSLALALASTIAATVVGAVLVQVFYRPAPIVSGWRAAAAIAKSQRNQMGFRGQPIDYAPDEFVVLLLGDSQVEGGFCCPYGVMPERRLQHYLNEEFGRRVKVFSIAATGYGQDQQLLALQEYYAAYRADLVVLWETPSNDVWNNMFPTHMPANGTPKPTFRLEQETLRGPSERMGEELAASPVKAITLLRRAFSPLRRDEEWERYLPEPYVPLKEYEGLVNDTWQRRANLGYMEHENLATEKSHLAMMLTPPSKRMRYGLELTRRLLKEMERLVTAHQGRMVAFHAASPDLAGGPVEVYVLNGLHYAASLDQFNANVAYINQDITFLPIPVTVPDYRISETDGHLTEQATDQVMRDLAGRLSGLIPGPAAPARSHP